jgi:hypothetical protein
MRRPRRQRRLRAALTLTAALALIVTGAPVTTPDGACWTCEPPPR